MRAIRRAWVGLSALDWGAWFLPRIPGPLAQAGMERAFGAHLLGKAALTGFANALHSCLSILQWLVVIRATKTKVWISAKNIKGVFIF